MSGDMEACRWIVSGVIELESPLMLRTGQEELQDSADKDAALTYAIEIDHLDRPLLTATALKSLLRNRLSAHDADISDLDLLFGHEPRQALAEDRTGGDVVKEARGGRAEFRNAFLIGANGAVQKRGMTRVERTTRTAADGSLRTQRVAEPGARFGMSILADGVTAQAAGLLIAALRLLDGGASSALGSGTGAGFGRIRWIREDEKLQRLDRRIVSQWLADGEGASWRDMGVLPAVEIDAIAADLGVPGPDRGAGTLPLEIAIAGYFLVSRADPKIEGKSSEGEARIKPLLARADVTAPYLPGTSLKGALRAQVERIWRTLTGDLEDGSDRPPAPIELLFGSVARSGLLRFSDFSGEPASLVRHDMVAIDRFTGGAADELKYASEVFASPTLVGELSLARPAGAPAAAFDETMGLLALALRDLAEGDVPLGYGSRKGYGAVASLTSEGGSPLEALGALIAGPDDATPSAAVRRVVAALRKTTKEPA